MLQPSFDTTNFDGQEDLQSVFKKRGSLDSGADAIGDGVIESDQDRAVHSRRRSPLKSR